MIQPGCRRRRCASFMAAALVPLIICIQANQTFGQCILPSDARIRVQLPPTTPFKKFTNQPKHIELIGAFIAVRGDTLIMRASGATQDTHLSTHSIDNLAISRGFRHNTGRSALLGFGLGLTGGFAVMYIEKEYGPSYRNVSQYLLPGGAIGAAVGATIGWFIKSEKWQDIAPDKLHIGLLPMPDHGGVMHVSLCL
jgi:hypothetical protein